jgi:hypothetical protein
LVPTSLLVVAQVVQDQQLRGWQVEKWVKNWPLLMFWLISFLCFVKVWSPCLVQVSRMWVALRRKTSESSFGDKDLLYWSQTWSWACRWRALVDFSVVASCARVILCCHRLNTVPYYAVCNSRIIHLHSMT